MQTTEMMEVEEVAPETEEVSVGGGGVLSVDADGLHGSLKEMADSLDVTGFKCSKCGLAHMHDTTKHRLSDDFDISEEDSATIEYNPVCHCGVQEAGRHGSELGIDEDNAASVAGGAPIPDDAVRAMDDQFGSL